MQWTKTDRGWFATDGKFRAHVLKPLPGGFMYHWGVRAGDRSGGSGGTSSATASKRAAEREIIRFKTFLKVERRAVS